MYIDDILVTGSTDAEHLNHLAQVLQRFQDAGMRLKKGKCSFLLSSVEQLGHTISARGLHTSDTKVSAIVNAPAPQNVTELGSFLPALHSTLSPLYQLLQKQKVDTQHQPRRGLSESEKLAPVLMTASTL